jgi:hypothetical protein
MADLMTDLDALSKSAPPANGRVQVGIKGVS